MGLIYSLTEMMSHGLTSEIREEKRSDGTIVITRHKNPWVAGLTVVTAAALLAMVLDGGNGTLTKIFGRSVVKLETPTT